MVMVRSICVVSALCALGAVAACSSSSEPPAIRSVLPTGGAVGPVGGQGAGGGPSGGSGVTGGMAVTRPQVSEGDRCLVPTVLFVIDGSGSMCAPFGGATRWQSLREALVGANGFITRLADRGVFGTLLYDGTIDTALLQPGAGGGGPACGAISAFARTEGECPALIDVPPKPNNFDDINSNYPQVELGGSTPTDRAMNYAVDRLTSPAGLDLVDPTNPQYIVLATDGEPNDICVGGAGGDGSAQRQGVVAAVDRAAAAGIVTFVISLAGDNATLQMHLDEVARHGDPQNPTARTYNPATPDDLVQNLTTVLTSAFDCGLE